MNPFERLGLSPNADERQIKLAYARELKQARPDQDPQGFQALHEAYSQCLAWARQSRDRAEAGADEERSNEEGLDESGLDDADNHEGELTYRLDPDEFRQMLDRIARRESAPATRHTAIEVIAPTTPLPIDPERNEPRPAPSWQHQSHSPAPGPQAWPRLDIPGAADSPAARHDRADNAFDDDAFDPGAVDRETLIENLMAVARRRPVREIERWLHAHPALYAVEYKHEIANELIERLHEEVPLPLAALETLLRFFDLDAIHPRFPHRHEEVTMLREQSLHQGAVIAELRGEYRSQAGHRRYRNREVRWFWFWIAALFAIGIIRVFVAARSI